MNSYFKRAKYLTKVCNKKVDLIFDENIKKADYTKNSQVKLKYDLSHLTQDSLIVLGPIQDDEAVFVYGLIKSIRPKTVIECGMGRGYSTINILQAIEQDSLLFTFDIEILNKNSQAFKDKRFKFITKSQGNFEHSDIDNRIIDFIYLDNGHYFDVNIQFWNKVVQAQSLKKLNIKSEFFQ